MNTKTKLAMSELVNAAVALAEDESIPLLQRLDLLRAAWSMCAKVHSVGNATYLAGLISSLTGR